MSKDRDAWEKLKKTLGPGFQVPDDSAPAMEMPEMDIRPEAQGRMVMPTMDLTRERRMPEMDLRPNVVKADDVEVPSSELEQLAKDDASKKVGELKPFSGWKQAPGSAEDEADKESADRLVSEAMNSGGYKKGGSVTDEALTRYRKGGSVTDEALTRGMAPDPEQPPPPGRDPEYDKWLATQDAKAKPAVAGPMRPSPHIDRAKALLAAINKNSVNPEGGDQLMSAIDHASIDPSSEELPRMVDQQRQPLRPASVPAQVGQAVMGATPSPGQPSGGSSPSGDSELAAAQRRARAAEREAQYTQGMGSAADIISGTHYNTHAGEDIRAAGKQGVQDVLDRESQAQRRATEGRAVEDQGFKRDANVRAGSVESRAAGADQRTQTTFNDAQEMDKPGTRKAQQWEVVARAKRPTEARRISPEQAKQMSANDWKEFLDAKDDPLAKVGGGASGVKGLTANQLSKLLPPNALDTHRTGQQIDADVQAMGGWDKLAAGFVKGMEPTGMLKQQEQNIRQNLAKMLGSYRKSIAGTAVTESEAKNVEQVASIIQAGKTIGELKNGFEILKDLNTNNVEQAIGLQNADVKENVRSLFRSKRGSILGNERAEPKLETLNGKQWEVVD